MATDAAALELLQARMCLSQQAELVRLMSIGRVRVAPPDGDGAGVFPAGEGVWPRPLGSPRQLEFLEERPIRHMAVPRPICCPALVRVKHPTSFPLKNNRGTRS